MEIFEEGSTPEELLGGVLQFVGGGSAPIFQQSCPRLRVATTCSRQVVVDT
jgi:hypothetical protein